MVEEGKSGPACSLKWAVLRCVPGRTLELEEKLLLQGLEVYAPREWRQKRVPRKRARGWEEVALLPSFLFLREEDMEELIWSREEEGVLGYRPMFLFGEVVLIRDEELAGLRESDRRGLPPGKGSRREARKVAARFQIGDAVRAKVLAGDIEGTVERVLQNGDVEIAGLNFRWKVKIPSLLLEKIGS